MAGPRTTAMRVDTLRPAGRVAEPAPERTSGEPRASVPALGTSARRCGIDRIETALGARRATCRTARLVTLTVPRRNGASAAQTGVRPGHQSQTARVTVLGPSGRVAADTSESRPARVGGTAPAVEPDRLCAGPGLPIGSGRDGRGLGMALGSSLGGVSRYRVGKETTERLKRLVQLAYYAADHGSRSLDGGAPRRGGGGAAAGRRGRSDRVREMVSDDLAARRRCRRARDGPAQHRPWRRVEDGAR